MKERKNKFGEVLKDLRKKNKLTQDKIGKLVNVDRSNVANYEAGKRQPTIESLIILSDFFRVSLDYLIVGKKKKMTEIEVKRIIRKMSSDEKRMIVNEYFSL